MKKKYPWVRAIMILVYAFMFLPIGIVILMSFNASPYGTFPFEFTTKWYELLFSGGDLGQAHALGGVVHALDIAVGPEELDGAVGGAIGLQPLENLLGIVQHFGRRIDLQRAIGDNPGVVPAPSGVIVHKEHMVRHALTKHQGGGIG